MLKILGLSEWCSEAEWNFEAVHDVELEIDGQTATVISTVRWSATPELRSWGFKGFYFSLPDQTISYIYTDEEGEEVSKDVEIKDVMCEVEESMVGGDLFMTRIEIDSIGKATAYFG